MDTSLSVGDIISIKACNTDNTWVLNNSDGLLVHHPDTLISSTAVVGSLFCPRKGVLTEWFRGIDGDSRIMVIGSLVHELLQEVNIPSILLLSSSSSQVIVLKEPLRST